MVRRLLLVGSPLTKDSPDFLFGVYLDMINYHNYFQSAIAGGWQNLEIKSLCNPSQRQLEQAILWCKGADIAIVIFSGHGHLIGGVQHIVLNGDETVPATSLYTNSKRQILVIDACRVETSYSNFSGKGLQGISRIQFDNSLLEYSRELYNQLLQQSPIGKVIILSASKNQYSDEIPTEGGVYSLSLLRSLKGWYGSNKGFQLSIRDAFNRANNHLKMNGSHQIPVGEQIGNVKVCNLPIAINVNEYLHHIRLIKRTKGASVMDWFQV